MPFPPFFYLVSISIGKSTKFYNTYKIFSRKVREERKGRSANLTYRHGFFCFDYGQRTTDNGNIKSRFILLKSRFRKTKRAFEDAKASRTLVFLYFESFLTSFLPIFSSFRSAHPKEENPIAVDCLF